MKMKSFAAFVRSKTVQCNNDALKKYQREGVNLGKTDTLGMVRLFSRDEECVRTTVDVGLRFNFPDEVKEEGFPFLVRCEFDLMYRFADEWTDEQVSEFLNMNAVQDCWGLFRSIAAGEAAQCGFMIMVPYEVNPEEKDNDSI